MLPGESFSAVGPNGPQQPQKGAVSSPLQDAIKILSFRMPTVVGQGSPSPLANNPMGGGQIEDWLRKLFQGILPAQAPSNPSQPATAGPASPFGPTAMPSPYAPPPPQTYGGAPPQPTQPTDGGPTYGGGPSAPPPNVVYNPPDISKMPAPGPSSDAPTFDAPPSFRDWLTPPDVFGGY